MIHTTFEGRPPHGEIVRGDVYLPEGIGGVDPEAEREGASRGDAPESAVIVVHGFKGFKDWGFFPHVCRRIASDGHAVVSFNFSRSGVGPDLENFTDLESFGRNTYSHEMEDLHWVVGEVAEGGLLPAPARRIACLGHSRGGGVAVVAAREDPRIDALVTWSSVATLDRWNEETRQEWRRTGRIHVLNGRTGQQMPLDVTLLDDFEANRERFDVARAARALEAPWLVVHGTDDAAVSSQDARILAEAGPRAELLLIEGAGHTFEVGHPFQGSSPELDRALEGTRRHLARHLRGAPTSGIPHGS